MILDTTFLLDLLRGMNDITDAVQRIDERGNAHVSSITIMELWEGIHHGTASERERKRVETLLSNIREAPFDRECAMVAGETNARLQQDGTRIESTDVMIAATALVHDMPVVTKNVDHFERIDDLDVLTY